MTHPFISQKNSPGLERLPEGRLAGFCCDEGNCPECLRAYREAYREGLAFRRRERAARKLRQSSPDGLKTAAQAAAKLNCSIKTLIGHVASGALRCVDVGRGEKRRRPRFADADLNECIANQTRKVTPSPSAAIRALRSGSTTSRSTIVAFSDLQKGRRDGKPKS